jgi:hypothetical protein
MGRLRSFQAARASAALGSPKKRDSVYPTMSSSNACRRCTPRASVRGGLSELSDQKVKDSILFGCTSVPNRSRAILRSATVRPDHQLRS